MHFLLHFFSTSTIKVYRMTVPNTDNRLRIRDGIAFHCEYIDLCFPMVWEVNEPPLVSWFVCGNQLGNICVYMGDNAKSTIARPLDPRSFMKKFPQHLPNGL